MYADASDKMPRLPSLAHLAPVMQAKNLFQLGDNVHQNEHS